MKFLSILILTVMINMPAGAQDLEFGFNPPNLNGINSTKLWGTYYHIWQAQESESGLPLLNNKNEPLTGNISEHDWCKGAIEGTIMYTSLDGTKETYNYADHKGKNQVDCARILGINPLKNSWIRGVAKSRFRFAKGDYGDGVKSFKLVPYRTIAVDKSYIPYGSVVFIPQARGKDVQLPSGNSIMHDGYFFAADTGGAIKSNHIDFFSGIQDSNPFPDFIKSKSNHTFDAYIINNADLVEKLRAQHE